jgi:hypothetical protein
MTKVLRVDSGIGDDTNAALNPYNVPFLTVEAAITASVSGDTIWILPSTYILSAGITVKSGTSLRGISTQTTTIGITGATGPTSLVTLEPNSRIEDLTLTLSG